MKIVTQLVEAWRKSISRHIANDRLHDGKDKNDGKSVFYRFINGCAPEMKRAGDTIVSIANEYDPQQTDILIERWESAVGIPDEIFSIAATIEERQENILLKLRSLQVSDTQDFIDLAALLGFDITITYGADSLYPPHDVPHFIVTEPQANFIWFVRSDTVLPQFLKDLFQKLKPAQSLLIFLS